MTARIVASPWRGRRISLRALTCLLLIAGMVTTAGSQTNINTTSNTIQIAGTPIAQSNITAPSGGFVLYGTALSPVTGQPVRHLWVADGTAGICRVDPDLDSAGPFAINPSQCPFQLNRSTIVGGNMAFDSLNNLLYLVDNQAKNSAGVLRIPYLPGGDSGQGSLDFANLFSLAGNAGSARPAGGQTTCALPGSPAPGVPNSVALDPEGNLWVGFGKSAGIVRINNPGTATSANSGSCAQFVQAVATTTNNRAGTGLAWVGHDLWGSSLEAVFVIPAADSTCLVGLNPVCNNANGTVIAAVPELLGVSSLVSDQTYPAINGNNLYFALSGNVAWMGNVSGGSSGQTLSQIYLNSAQFSPALKAVGALVVDGTDPANLVLYAGEDSSGLGTAGAGRWFQNTQTSAAPGIPGVPLDVNAFIAAGQASLSWSPAQVAQPVTSYTVHNSFSSDGSQLNDVTVTPAAGGLFPPTSTTITGLNPGVSYQFEIAANNAQGPSTLSAPSIGANPLPSAPTILQTIAGDTQAYVSWSISAHSGTLPITSYTITGLVNGLPAGITATVPAPNGSTGSFIFSGLTNGTNYTFTVHASNGNGDGPESSPSNPVNPAVSNLPIMSVLVTGPVSVTPVPALVTYHVTVTNTSVFPATNILVSNLLSTTDGAFIIVGEPDQGSCSAGGSGVTNVVCSLGAMAGGAVQNIDVVVQMQKAQITLSSRVTGTDVAGDSLTFKLEHRTTTPPGTPPPPNAPVVSVPVQAQCCSGRSQPW